MGARLWFYRAVMIVPPLLLAVGTIAGVVALWRRRREATMAPEARTPLPDMIVPLTVLIPLAFVLLGVQTSPTYLPFWYPLPFAVMGWAMAGWTAGRRRGRLSTATQGAAIAVLVVQLAFFCEHLQYIDRHGGVPDSPLDRSYAGLREDIAMLAAEVEAAEIAVEYPHPNMREAVAYLCRHADWRRRATGRVLIHYRPPWAGTTTIEPLLDSALPENAFLIHPWGGEQQRGGLIHPLPSEGVLGGGITVHGSAGNS
jgi:hypothetical protein